MKLTELFEELQSTEKCQTKLSALDIESLERYMNGLVFSPKDQVQKAGIVLDLDLPTQRHFHQRAIERNVSDCEIEQALKKGWNQNFEKIRTLSKQENPEADYDDLHFVDPSTGIDIPMLVEPNPVCDPTKRSGNTAVCQTKGGLKAPKNRIIAKTVVKRGSDSRVMKGLK